jgi:drug/metabolite transporter (DMT)-like permease
VFPDPQLRHGALYAVGAGLAFAIMGAFIKTAAQSLPNETVVFLRNLFGLLILTLWLRPRPRDLRTQRPGGHLLRAVFGLTAMYCFFYALARLHLATAMLLNYSTPLFIPLIAWAWLGERPAPAVWLAVVLGFAGVALILKPGFALLSWAGLAGLLAGLFAALAMTNIRRISATEPVSRIVLYFAGLGTLISALPMCWAWRTPSRLEAGLMLGAGLFATLGQLWLTRAYSLAPAARIGSLVYSAVVFAALLGWLLWDERPDLLSVLGMLLVAAAGMLATTRAAGDFRRSLR